jgi:hypothetical protein
MRNLSGYPKLNRILTDFLALTAPALTLRCPIRWRRLAFMKITRPHTLFVLYADRVLLTMHGFFWMAVTIVWAYAWRIEPAAAGPPYRFATQFISRVDALISPQIEILSVSWAMWLSRHGLPNVGLTFAILFGILILLGGSLQWFLMGRLIRWIADKYGQASSILFSMGIFCWITLAFISWVG